MLTALLLDHVVSSTVVTGFNLSVLHGVKTVYIGGGLADDQEASEGQAWCTSRWCVSRRAHPPLVTARVYANPPPATSQPALM